jgi:maltooligosyltrehalose trehalohydrolase
MAMSLETARGARTDAAAAATAPAGGWRAERGVVLDDGGATFTVWAPSATSIVLHVGTGAAHGDHAMSPAGEEPGVFTAYVSGVREGDRYGYRLDDGDPIPDPVSRAQPDGVHGLSQVVNPAAFAWDDAHWPGLALADFLIYEMHVGAFTPEGTFDAAAARLPELLAMGVTAVEVMPIAAFPGRRNWGYDGVHLYAPQASYGGPDGFRRFVRAAHALGLAVVLDVVYNHVGPEGNYLDRYGPYFTESYRTPWGRAINYDGRGSDEVRRWARDNALHWIADYHVDALRLDAVHGIFDFGAVAFLEELSDAVHALGRQLGRKVQLLAESDLNDPRLVRSPERGGYGLDAQWADDVHHTIHATLTGESTGYYADFLGVATIADVYREPFFYARRYSRFRGRTHGRPATDVPKKRFVVSAQNHDQVGNRPEAERLAVLVPPEKLRLAAALVLLSPYVPMLFMGEEYGETAPFLYFTEHGDPALIEAVREGRKREFVEIERRGDPPDAQAEETFLRSRLQWERRAHEPGASLLQLYTDLAALRREEPALRPGESELVVSGEHEWCTMLRTMTPTGDIFDTVRARRMVFQAFNLSDAERELPVPGEAAGCWRLRLTTDAAGYGGRGGASASIPAPTLRVGDDAPKRLLAAGDAEAPPRVIRLAPWSAAVYVPDLDGEATR